VTKTLLRPALLVLALAFGAGALAACDNTIRGIGTDVKDSGRAVEDAVS